MYYQLPKNCFTLSNKLRQQILYTCVMFITTQRFFGCLFKNMKKSKNRIFWTPPDQLVRFQYTAKNEKKTIWGYCIANDIKVPQYSLISKDVSISLWKSPKEFFFPSCECLRIKRKDRWFFIEKYLWIISLYQILSIVFNLRYFNFIEFVIFCWNNNFEHIIVILYCCFKKNQYCFIALS